MKCSNFIDFLSLNQIVPMNKCVLITGGTGYIGSHTVVNLIERGYTPIILDNFENSNPTVLDAIHKITGTIPIFYKGDCRDLAIYRTIFKTHKVEYVIHFAAYKSVNESVVFPIKYFDNNLISLIKLLEAMQENGVKNILFSSSCTVYGDPTSSTVTEDTPLKPASSPYGMTKKIGEEILTSVCCHQKAIRAIFLRYFNPVGAHPSGLIGESPKGIPNNLFPFVSQTLTGKREKLWVFGNDYSTPDGTCIRDFVHVVDLAKAHVSAIDYFTTAPDFEYEIFNIGTGVGTSILEVIQGFEKITGQKISWEFAPRRDGDIQEIFANVDKALKHLNWKPYFTVEDAIKHSWNWEKGQQNA
jgi:UDP-glucose 4-epimerase